jgi:predicted ATPase
VVDKVTGRYSFGIALYYDEHKVRWRFEAEDMDKKAMSAIVSLVVTDGSEHRNPGLLRFLFPGESRPDENHLANRLLRLSYLTAERVGPREVYPLEDPRSTQVVGPRGESAVSLLYWGRDEKVIDRLIVDEAPPTRLQQVGVRMNEFFPGCSLDVQPVPQANGVTLGLRTSDETGFHRPIHVGFGLTQVLPIVVAALSGQANDILLIENPEVHLHPAGQAKIGAFLTTVAAAGIQVILETHSDHVLNGVRRSVKAGVINHENVVCHFFRDRAIEADQVISPTIDKDGNVDVWPDGFFDQFDKDMNYFAGWGD